MQLLIYLADNSVAVRQDLREEDSKHKLQQEFRHRLSLDHTPRRFSSPSELAQWVAADLHNYLSGRTIELTTHTLFGPDDIGIIKEKFDGAVQEQIREVEQCLNFVVEQFEHIFLIDKEDLLQHGLLSKLHDRLVKSIPSVAFEFADGVIRRTGVRHVVLRSDTFRLLLESVPTDARFTLGKKIGCSAADDLVTNTIQNKKLIPNSPNALLALWDYWDRTGGWGKICPAAITPGEKSESRSPEWRILLRHNSLASSDSISNDPGLANFWKGYIWGFLDKALGRLSNIIFDLPDADRDQVTIPPYMRVTSVTHQRGDGTVKQLDPEEDLFVIGFKEETLSDARQLLVRSQQQLLQGQPFPSMAFTRLALKNAKHKMNERFDSMLGEISLSSVQCEQLAFILSDDAIPKSNEEDARSWFKLANLVIQHLSKDVEPL